MEKGVLDTEIDELLVILSSKGQMTLKEASTLAQVSEKVMQGWVDFLVEEKIVTLEYNLFTPIIKLTPEKRAEIEKKRIELERRDKEAKKEKTGLAGEFFEKTKKRGIEPARAKALWKKYLDVNAQNLKAEFTEKARRRGIDGDIEKFWMIFFSQMRELDGSR